MENQSKFKTSKDIISYLATQFPQCFSVEGEAKPLKIGIFQDIVARLDDETLFSKVRLRAALRTYTLSWRYLHCIKADQERVDLDGNPCGVLTAEHVEHARLKLKEGKDKLKAQRIEQQKAAKVANKGQRSVKTAKTVVDGSTKKVSKKSKTTSAKSNDAVSITSAALATLRAGDEVKVNLSSKPVTAIFVANEKDNVRVKLSSGMELTVKSEYIIK
jgi:ProP effector